MYFLFSDRVMRMGLSYEPQTLNMLTLGYEIWVDLGLSESSSNCLRLYYSFKNPVVYRSLYKIIFSQLSCSSYHGGGEGDVVYERGGQGRDPHHQDDGYGQTLVFWHGLRHAHKHRRTDGERLPSLANCSTPADEQTQQNPMAKSQAGD